MKRSTSVKPRHRPSRDRLEDGKWLRYAVATIFTLVILAMIGMAVLWLVLPNHEAPCSWFDNAGPLNTPMRCWPQYR